MVYTNKHDLPQFVVDFLVHSDYPKPKDGVVGVTTLIDSPRIRRLKSKHAPAGEAIDSFHTAIGTAVHERFRVASDEGVVEQRFDATARLASGRDITISGQPDRVVGNVLYDIKTTKAASLMYGIKPAWEAQLNVYRWLLHMNGIEVDTIRVVSVYKDWSVGEQRRFRRMTYTYPDIPIGITYVNAWPMEKTSEFIHKRLELHYQDALPECTFEERWARAGTYAVQSGTKYRAVRVLDTLDDAIAWADEQFHTGTDLRIEDDRVKNERGIYIVRRPERWVRCESYCPVAAVCQQYQEFKNGDAG